MRGDEVEENYPRSKPHGKADGLLSRWLSRLLRSDDLKREKKRLLRRVERRLRKQRPRLYNHRNQTAEPALARLFHELYRVLGPAQAILQSAGSSKVLKQVVVEVSLTERQLALKECFSEDAIRQRATSTEPKQLAEDLNDDWREFCNGFNSSAVKKIQQEYELVRAMVALIGYDYHFLLHQFDPKFPEGAFLYNPHFSSLKTHYIAEELKHSCELLCGIDTKGNWVKVLDILREYRQNEVVSRDGWEKLLKRIERLQSTGTLELMVQLIEGDPFYQPEMKQPSERIVDGYLSKLRVKIDLVVKNVLNERRTEKRYGLAMKVFGNVSMSKLTNYTKEASRRFSKKTLRGYIHTVELEYLKAFLLDYYKRDVKEVVGLLLIKGKWAGNRISGPLSDAHQQLLIISKKVLEFDASLGEDEQLGMVVKNASIKAIRSKSSVSAFAQILNDINETAKDLIFLGAHNLITLGKALRAVMDDYKRRPSELILNWQELNVFSENRIRERMIEVYKKLFLFVQLLRMCTK